jgi:hypothetical protein
MGGEECNSHRHRAVALREVCAEACGHREGHGKGVNAVRR